MRILSIHNQYQIRGGEDESREAEERILRAHGHQVDVYEEHNSRVKDLSKVQMALRTIWSTESYRQVKARLQHQRPDLVHIQNFFPLISPAVHHAAKSLGIPVVQSLRNYRLLCPNGFFFREGRVCELCLPQAIPVSAVKHGCYRCDRAATSVLSTMLVTHRLLRTWQQQVDIFITLSEFARQKYIQGGFPADKIFVKPNFVDPDPGVGDGSGNYALYVGRLSPEKGITTLLQAWESIGTHLPLKLVGEGPLAPQVQQAATRSSAIEWLGRKPLSAVYDLIGHAKVVIFSTEGYETFGRVIIEAYAKGTPVIATNLGSAAELVIPYQTGLLFQPNNPQDLADKVHWLLSHPTQTQAMRHTARHTYETHYTAEHNYHHLLKIYQTTQTP